MEVITQARISTDNSSALGLADDDDDKDNFVECMYVHAATACSLRFKKKINL